MRSLLLRKNSTPAGGRRWLTIAAGAACLSMAAAACSAGGSHDPPARPTPSRPASPAAPHTATTSMMLQVIPAPYQLPRAVAREVALPDGPDLLIIGGLTPSGASTRAVIKLNPVSGRTSPAGRLASPTHDAAGAVLHGRPYVFGGGATVSVPDIQALAGTGTAVRAGNLPGPRSDLSSVTLGTTAYLLGGYDGASYDPAVLATADGVHLHRVARLPVPVRYAAVAGAGNRIWVFGGETPSGFTRVIQQVNLTTGKAAVVGHLPAPLAGATGFVLGGRVFVAGGQTGQIAQPVTTRAVLSFDPARHRVANAGQLPVGVSNAAAAVVAGTAYLIGGNDGQRQVPGVTQLRLVPATAAVLPASGPLTGPGFVPAGNGGASVAGPLTASLGGAAAGPPSTPSTVLANAPWLGPPLSRGHLMPHSDPSVLPGDVLIADDWNNRLLIVDPQGRVRWEFPRPGDLARGQTFLLPDDAFFSPNGHYIVATEEENSVVSVINIARHRIIYRYGTPGVAGSGPNQVSNPDDAMMMPDGNMITADIKNCRVLLLAPPFRQLHRPRRIIGTTGSCFHSPPHDFGSPNGAFPATDGDYIVTEINQDWANMMSLNGHIAWSTHPPGVAYPSDTNEIYPGRYLTVDYSSPGQVVEFNAQGKLLWRFGGLNHPSLALPLPNGDILLNDDYNDRVIVIDPATNRIVWQYGHKGVPGTAPGYLNDPDGVDLTPPDSMLIIHAATMGQP